MITQTLNGTWELLKLGDDTIYTGNVPGCVHTDLLDAKIIKDPFYRDQELDAQWIGETDWVYRRSFTVSDDLLAQERVVLHCDGLDTIASVRLNGVEIGTADNMFRTWEYDVKSHLRPGENQIEVIFYSAMQYVRSMEAERGVMYAWSVGPYRLNGGGWIRKQPSNFGWDWGPALVTAGIWRDISLIGYSTRLQEVHIRQDHSQAGKVRLNVKVTAENLTGAKLRVRCTVSFDGDEVTSSEVDFSGDEANLSLDIPNPQLWWISGLGAQPLYHVKVELLRDGQAVDTDEKRIGLRTLRLDRHDDEKGESFQFLINGHPFFAKGANWIPADAFVTAITKADYRRLLQDAVDANMNMLRVWGGGIYEPDMFYDLCDELGICLWQDFMFACSVYPAYDEVWMQNVDVEAQQNIKRIRHHASLALWCGNNELEQGLVGDEWTDHTMSWKDYGLLFDDLLAKRAAELDPDTSYWPGSPHTPRGDRKNFNDPTSGDAHLWSVWHGRQPFEWYRTCTHRFNSEFGFQSFPEPATVATYTAPEDRNVTSFVMEHHQRSPIGNGTIIHYMTDWYLLPTSFEMTLWMSQIVQGMAMKYAVEHWRRGMPYQMGTLYWQINDNWQVASWSSIDYLGRWKALHHMAKHFYAPLLVSGVEDMQRGTVDVHVTNDHRQAFDGVLVWRVTDTEGAQLASAEREIHIPASQSNCIEVIDASELLKSHSKRDLLVWLELQVNGKTVSRNLAHFARPKHLKLTDPGLATQIEALDSGAFAVTITASTPALYVWLDSNDIAGRSSDNFFHLQAGETRTVEFTPQQPITKAEITSKLRVYNLMDTYAG